MLSSRGRWVIAVVALAVVAGGIGLWARSTSPAPSCTSPRDGVSTTTYASRPGVDANLTSLDIYASPGAEGCPILVWVHGGSWQEGDKSTRLTRTKADHFIEQGWIFVSVNYRLADESNDVRWPAFGEDVAASVGWLIDNAEEFGGDASRVSLMGHSSGAHLVSIVGTNPDLLAAEGLNLDSLSCVVSLDSVTHDLTDPPPWEVDIIDLAFPTEPDRVSGSPTLQVEALNNSAGSTLPDFLIVTRGREQRIASSERLASAITNADGTAEVLDVSPYDHGEVSSEIGIDGEQLVTPPVDEFLMGCQAPA